jgi:NADPH:quinone reductase-like Zn-dependent oxidoreductase
MSTTPLTKPLPEFDLDHLTSGGSYGIRAPLGAGEFRYGGDGFRPVPVSRSQPTSWTLTGNWPTAFLDTVAAGTTPIPIGHVYRFAEIAEAHAAMESSQAAGKLVVLT